jgi:hypothetical protein
MKLRHAVGIAYFTLAGLGLLGVAAKSDMEDGKLDLKSEAMPVSKAAGGGLINLFAAAAGAIIISKNRDANKIKKPIFSI